MHKFLYLTSNPHLNVGTPTNYCNHPFIEEWLEEVLQLKQLVLLNNILLSVHLFLYSHSKSRAQFDGHSRVYNLTSCIHQGVMFEPHKFVMVIER
jgi:hypothetical protein